MLSLNRFLSALNEPHPQPALLQAPSHRPHNDPNFQGRKRITNKRGEGHQHSFNTMKFMVTGAAIC